LRRWKIGGAVGLVEGGVLALRGTANNDVLTLHYSSDAGMIGVFDNDVMHSVSLVGVSGILIEGV
jgi:hypothetical protein